MAASQLAVTPVQGDLIPSPGFLGYQACPWYTDLHADKTSTHVNKLIKKFFLEKEEKKTSQQEKYNNNKSPLKPPKHSVNEG